MCQPLQSKSGHEVSKFVPFLLARADGGARGGVGAAPSWQALHKERSKVGHQTPSANCKPSCRSARPVKCPPSMHVSDWLAGGRNAPFGGAALPGNLQTATVPPTMSTLTTVRACRRRAKLTIANCQLVVRARPSSGCSSFSPFRCSSDE